MSGNNIYSCSDLATTHTIIAFLNIQQYLIDIVHALLRIKNIKAESM